MEIHKKFDELVTMIESARTMPMSSSAMLNKGDVLGLIGQIRDMLPESLAAADTVIAQREELLEEARANAAKMISDAKLEQATLVGEHTVLVEARRERGRLLEQTRLEIEAMKTALDDHVDAKLARFEVVAERILETVRTGREQLRHSTSPYDELSAVFEPEVTGTDDASESAEEPPPDEPAELAHSDGSSTLDDGLPPRS